MVAGLQIPYVTGESISYLIKMKTDTSHFINLGLGKYFNFCESTKSDPFLIQSSLQASGVAVGSGIRAIKKGKLKDEKIVVPLHEHIINKAKACEEVILFERGDLRNILSSNSQRVLAKPLSNPSITAQPSTEEKENVYAKN